MRDRPWSQDTVSEGGDSRVPRTLLRQELDCKTAQETAQAVCHSFAEGISHSQQNFQSWITWWLLKIGTRLSQTVNYSSLNRRHLISKYHSSYTKLSTVETCKKSVSFLVLNLYSFVLLNIFRYTFVTMEHIITILITYFIWIFCYNCNFLMQKSVVIMWCGCALVSLDSFCKSWGYIPMKMSQCTYIPVYTVFHR